jgi:hydroxyacylglutathione hydrolase
MTTSRLYFRQLLAGRDFAKGNHIAKQMVNFAYVIGDRETGEALLIDPTYGVSDLLEILAEDEMTPVGVLATHYHPDHVGGSLGGNHIDGIAALLEQVSVPIHVQAAEVTWVERTTGVSSELVAHKSGDVVMVGEIPVTLLHTPGHTPGSQCFLVEGAMMSGDTLFLEGCGRTDLPGSDPQEMYRTLTARLSAVPDSTMLFPGHLYSEAPCQTMELTRAYNYVLAPRSESEWLRMFS